MSQIKKHQRKISTKLCHGCSVYKPLIEFRGSKYKVCKDCQKLTWKFCGVKGCQNKHFSLGYCRTHTSRLKRKGDVEAHIPILNGFGPLSTTWKGGETRLRNGRVMIYAPAHPRASAGGGRYVFRYVLTIEKYLGRFLSDDEIVHHINGDHTDDRLENLQVMTRGEHNQLHYKGRKYFKVYR
jgi:hypothetical protein